MKLTFSLRLTMERRNRTYLHKFVHIVCLYLTN